MLRCIFLMTLFLSFSFCSALAQNNGNKSSPEPQREATGTRQADVLVYGSTPGGFCAAIAAAREGASVILLEPTGHVGGVNTGGLSFSDSNQTVRSTVMGLFDEWHRRIEADYERRGVELPYDVSVKDSTHWTYEPHVAARVTRQMLDEAEVKVLTEHRLESVVKQKGRIKSLQTSQGRFTASAYIDATYEGDLMAQAGVSWTIGRENRAEYGESLAGKQYPKGEMPISGYDSSGKPLPLITSTQKGSEEKGDQRVMVYSFRLCLTKDPENRVPFPEPDNYEPARFEIVRRYFRETKRPIILWDLYSLPGQKWDANNGIGKQFSLGLVGACNGWSEANAEERERIFEQHKQYTLEMYRFLTTDPAVPVEARKRLSEFGLCKDEFPETDHFSPQLYVREGRRMQGMYVLSQNDIMEDPRKKDPIAVSSFPIDSHDCQRIALPEGGVVNEGTIFPVRMKGRRHGYPYHVPYRAILPKPEECRNLLVPVALSSTHVAFSSIRVEPTWMLLGQSAGIAAATAAKEEVDVQSLPYPQLRECLLAQGQVLELPGPDDLPPIPQPAVSIDPKSLPGIVLDDRDAELKGEWFDSTNFKPHIGRGYIHDEKRGNGKSVAIFRFQVPKSGRYELKMAYSAHETRAPNIPVEVTSGDFQKELTVDQTIAIPHGQHFRSLGEVTLTADIDSAITIRNLGTEGFVICDAFQLLPVEESQQ